MFYMDKDKRNIYVTRGDMLPLTIDATNEDKTPYKFVKDDVIRIKVMEAGNVSNVLVQKDFTVEEETTTVDIDLTSEETKIGDLINEPEEYWYEIELNPEEDNTNTIVGYENKKGAALFTLLPEGGDKK